MSDDPIVESETFEVSQARIKYGDSSWTGLKEELTKEELKLIWEFLKWQHLPYNNYELYEAVRKLSRIIRDE